MPRPLKIFQAHLGFYDTVVAAPSRAAALKAWGSQQDLFRSGSAKETNDPQAVTAALAKPGVVLRRPVGSNAAFSENPGLPQIPAAPKKKPPPVKAPEPVAKKKAPPPAKANPKQPQLPLRPHLKLVPAPKAEPPPRPSPSRAPIEAAEKHVVQIKEDEKRRLQQLEARKAALDEEARRVRAEFRDKRDVAEKALSEARKAYQDALKRG